MLYWYNAEMPDVSTAPLPAVQILEVSVDEAGQRIDNFLLRLLKGVPKSRIYRIIRKGEVRVNRGRIRPEYRVQAGDQIRVPPVRVAVDNGPAEVPKTQQQRLLEHILYEDDRLLVINKPAGMAVHGGSGLSYGVIEALRAARPESHYLELVHRLDRGTSGCLMIAKKRSELRQLHELLRLGRMEKCYLALVKGDWQNGARRVTEPLQKNLLRGGERVVRVDPQGKQADTRFKPVSVFADASLLEVELGTGRTHQIRVHAAHIGHPLAGDDKYGDPDFNKRMRQLGLRRLFLHAQSLGFRNETNGREVFVSAPLTGDLREALDRLEQSAAVNGDNREYKHSL